MPQLPHIDKNAPWDWGRASTDYARFRDIYPDSFYQTLRQLGIGLPGQQLLDLGTGTGVLPRAFCAREPALRCTGADISPQQIAQARALSQGLPIDYIVSPAEEVSFVPQSFHAVTACQCFWYFERPAVLARVHELLRPEGLFAILSMTWLVQQSKIARQSEALVLKHNPNWTGGGVRRRWFLPKPKWAAPQFLVKKRVLYCEAILFTRESWHGRMLACRGIGASALPLEQIAAFSAEHLAFVQTLPPQFAIPHQVSMLVLKKA